MKVGAHMWSKYILKGFLMMAVVVGLSACGGKAQAPEPNPTPEDMKAGEGLFSGKSGNLLDAFRQKRDEGVVAGSGIGVNSYLWRASLEALSFMPMQQADSAGGVLITDWYTNPQNDMERVKVNVYILGRTLRPQTLKVNVFKQMKDGDSWKDSGKWPGWLYYIFRE